MLSPMVKGRGSSHVAERVGSSYFQFGPVVVVPPTLEGGVTKRNFPSALLASL